MDWFEGNVSVAISEAKKRSSLFVVAVHGPTEDQSTKDFLGRLDSPEISGKLKSNRSVCIKLENGSEACLQFSQIYPVILVPSIYFINSLNGVDLEATAGDDLTVEKLTLSVDKALEAMGRGGEASKPPVSASDVMSPRGVRVEEAKKVLQDSMPTTKGEEKNNDNESDSTKPLTLEERVARAKELLVAKKAMKEYEEKEKEKNAEKERRELGKNLSEIKRKQEDDALREAAEERRKDKEEARLAKERVRAQLEQDRIERAAKFNQHEQERLAKIKQMEKEKLVEAARIAEQEAIQHCQIARIQFRLPDGRSVTKQFNPDDPLQELYKFVRSDIDIKFQNFSLSTTFPNRQLDNESQTSSLKELNLVPSATVLILPKGNSSLIGQDGGIVALIWLILTPFTALLGFLSGLFNSGGNDNSNTTTTTTTTTPGRSTEPRSQTKRDGNMARLRNNMDDDDENNTYNGNSTQQM